MTLSKENQAYLDKLRRNYPNRDIPNDETVEQALLTLNNDEEEVIDDLVIRVWDNIVELELI